MTRAHACLLAAWLFAVAPAMGQTVVPAQSEIVFVSRQMGVPIEGRFKRFDAQLSFDPRRPEAATVALTVAMASAAFGASEAEAEVAKPAWFDVARFPQATFQSAAVKPLGEGRFAITGRLTVKGTARELAVPVTITQSGRSGTVLGSFTLKRLDFGIGEGEWADTSLVANEVQVRFRIALEGMAPP